MDGSVREAAAAAGPQQPWWVLDREAWGSASGSPWIDVVTEIVAGLDPAIVQGEAPTVAKGTPCIGVECQGGMRGIDVVVLIAIACVVAGVTAAAAIRNRRPWILLAMVGYFRTAGDRAAVLGHRFAAPFKSRE